MGELGRVVSCDKMLLYSGLEGPTDWAGGRLRN